MYEFWQAGKRVATYLNTGGSCIGCGLRFAWCTCGGPKPEPPLGWRCPVCGRGLAPEVKECSCVKVRRSGVLEDSLAWIYEDFTPPKTKE